MLMLEASHNNQLPEIPAKRYFTIGEVSELCDVKPHVLRYWEQEFKQLAPVKRRGNRRFYQRKDIDLIRQISNLLYGEGFTISGARQQLESEPQKQSSKKVSMEKEEFRDSMLSDLKELRKLLD